MTFYLLWFTGSEVQSTDIKAEMWHHPGRHGVGGAEGSTSLSKGSQRQTGHALASRRKSPKLNLTVTHLLQ